MSRWHPKQGERVYVSHAVTKHNFESCYFVRWWHGCLIVFYKNKLHRLHVRHSGMKQIINLSR